MRRLAAILPLVLASCAPGWPSPVEVAADRSPEPAMPAVPSVPFANPFSGYYVGTWTPGPCAGAAPVSRTMLVETLGPASGVNYPLRGTVAPDGTASLAYGKAALVGRFDAKGSFTGRANTGRASNGQTCLWDVAMTRQPPIGSADPNAAPPPAAIVNQSEIP